MNEGFMKIRILFLSIVFISITTYLTEATCAANEFECADGACIQSVYQCDDSFECLDFSDELNCTVEQPCAEGLHKCSSGQCVANSNDCPLDTSEIQTTAAQSVTQPSDDSLSALQVGIIIVCVLLVVILISIVLIYEYKKYIKRKSLARVAPVAGVAPTNHENAVKQKNTV